MPSPELQPNNVEAKETEQDRIARIRAAMNKLGPVTPTLKEGEEFTQSNEEE